MAKKKKSNSKNRDETYRLTPKGFFMLHSPNEKHLLDLILANMTKFGENALIWNDKEKEFVWAKVEWVKEKKKK